MNGWLLAGLFLLWAISVAGLVFMIRRWRLVEEVPPAGKRESREKTLSSIRERLKKERAKIPPNTKRALEILGPLAQDKKMMVGQIKKWLSEKEDAKTKR